MKMETMKEKYKVSLPIIDEEDLAIEKKADVFLNEVLKYSENMRSINKS